MWSQTRNKGSPRAWLAFAKYFAKRQINSRRSSTGILASWSHKSYCCACAKKSCATSRPQAKAFIILCWWYPRCTTYTRYHRYEFSTGYQVPDIGYRVSKLYRSQREQLSARPAMKPDDPMALRGLLLLPSRRELITALHHSIGLKKSPSLRSCDQ